MQQTMEHSYVPSGLNSHSFQRKGDDQPKKGDDQPKEGGSIPILTISY